MTTPETIERDLALVDDALTTGAATAADPIELELQELALALAAEAPPADPAFAERLEERVKRGFPREERQRRSSVRMKLAAAALASVLLAATVGSMLWLNRDVDQEFTALSGEGPKLSIDEDAAGGGGAEQAAPDDSRSGTIAPGESNRRIERSAALTLAAPGDELDKVADQIIGVADRQRGFVLRSSVTSGDDGAATGGHFELRIPNRRLQVTLRELSALADVRARTQAGEDVTRAFVTTQDRLDHARAERRGLLRRLERAATDREAAAIRQRLNLVSGEVRGLQSQLRDLRERTTYAAVTVDLQEDDAASTGNGDDGGGGTGAAFDDALGSLVSSFNIAVRVLGVAIPIGLVSLLMWLGVGLVRRRRREAALS